LKGKKTPLTGPRSLQTLDVELGPAAAAAQAKQQEVKGACKG